MPYSRKDVYNRVLELGSSKEQVNRKWTVKLAPPVLYELHDRPTGFFHIPHDVLNQIVRQCDRKHAGSLAMSCRAGYRYADAVNPLGRLPGLIADLHRLHSRGYIADQDGIMAFLDVLEVDGGYDRALLTPLSPAVRCAAGFAVLLWTPYRLGGARLGDIDEMDMVNMGFVEKYYHADFLPAIRTLLPLVNPNELRPRKQVEAFRIFFRSGKLSAEIKMPVFRKLLELTTDHFTLYTIAKTNELPLGLVDIGVLAMGSFADEYSFPELAERYVEASAGELNKAAHYFVDFQITDIDIYGDDFLSRKIHILLGFLSVVGDANAIDNELCVKMTSLLETALLNHDLIAEEIDRMFSGTCDQKNEFLRRFNDSQFLKKIDKDGVEWFVEGAAIRGAKLKTFLYSAFAYLLIEKIGEFKGYLDVGNLISGIHAVVQKRKGVGINFDAYVRKKLAGLN